MKWQEPRVQTLTALSPSSRWVWPSRCWSSGSRQLLKLINLLPPIKSEWWTHKLMTEGLLSHHYRFMTYFWMFTQLQRHAICLILSVSVTHYLISETFPQAYWCVLLCNLSDLTIEPQVRGSPEVSYCVKLWTGIFLECGPRCGPGLLKVEQASPHDRHWFSPHFSLSKWVCVAFCLRRR